jgi:NADH-quinone oxidoreductase subunit L
MGVVAASLTAFYSWRLIFMTFHGKSRASKRVLGHVHESPLVMTIPLAILAIGAVFAGGFSAKILGIVDADLSFWNGSIAMLSHFNVLEAAHHVPAWVKSLPLVVGFGGLGLAFILYVLMPSLPRVIARIFKPLYIFLSNKWFIDELYDFLFVNPTKKLGSFLWKAVDAATIDRLGPNGAAWLAMRFSHMVSYLQSGYIYVYAFVTLFGLIGAMSWFIFQF